MRIAYLSIGGHIHTERWLRFFVERGHDVHLMTVQPVADRRASSVHDIRTGIPFKPLHYAVALGRVKRILADIEPDLLHTHFLTGYGYWGAFSGFHPIVLTVWGDDVYLTPQQSFLKGKLARASPPARRSRHRRLARTSLSGPSRWARRGTRATSSNGGWTSTAFRPDAPSDVRAQLGIPPDAPVVISIRSFTQPYYNIDVIVRAIPAILDRRPDTHFIVAGNEGDDAEFRALAGELGDRREGALRREAYRTRSFRRYLVTSDVFLSVPSVDATAVSLLEAMACGTPVVVSSLDSALEWVTDGVNGLVVPPRDQSALEAAVLTLIDSPERRREFGAVSAKLTKERADHNAHMAKMEELCFELVERWRRAGGAHKVR